MKKQESGGRVTCPEFETNTWKSWRQPGRPPPSPRPSPTAPGLCCPQALPWAPASLSGTSSVGLQTERPFRPPYPEHPACFSQPRTRRAGEAPLSGNGLGFCLLSDCREHPKWLKYYQNATPPQFSTVTVVRSTTQMRCVTVQRQIHIPSI